MLVMPPLNCELIIILHFIRDMSRVPYSHVLVADNYPTPPKSGLGFSLFRQLIYL